jgi:saccharopine dehydrogenase-like NADP-dependent oxidoreductase
LTASYLDADIRSMEQEIKEKGLIFLCEMGLDPGIDHMSAMEMIERIRKEGGSISSFRSHCGGLVAPGSDDNPWRYKISWNPRNVVMAGKQGADFLFHGQHVHLPYAELFDPSRSLRIDTLDPLCWYPNRDSISYIDIYKLQEAQTFIRTTLRYPEFVYGWLNLIQLKLTDEEQYYETDGMSLCQFFKTHFDANNFGDWVKETITSRFEETKELLDKVSELQEAEQQAGKDVVESLDDLLLVDHKGKLKQYNLESIKHEAAVTVASRMHEANLALKQLFFLGLEDEETIINKGRCSAAEVLQFILERKLSLQPGNTDMVVMVHEIEYEKGELKHRLESSLIVLGEDDVRTAMAKTVGLPLGIAATMILEGKITISGLHIPIIPEIYTPLLEELKNFNIIFHERDCLIR